MLHTHGGCRYREQKHSSVAKNVCLIAMKCRNVGSYEQRRCLLYSLIGTFTCFASAMMSAPVVVQDGRRGCLTGDDVANLEVEEDRQARERRLSNHVQEISRSRCKHSKRGKRRWPRLTIVLQRAVDCMSRLLMGRRGQLGTIPENIRNIHVARGSNTICLSAIMACSYRVCASGVAKTKPF